MITKNGGLFYGTLIDTGTLSSVLKDYQNNLINSNVTCGRSDTTGNSVASFNNRFDYTVLRTFCRIGYSSESATINDYALGNELDDNNVNINDVVICSNARREVNGFIPTTNYDVGLPSDGTICYIFTFYNNTNNDIKFYEIGLFVNNDVVSPTHPFMTVRNVNKSGWTIKAREDITMSIEINFAGGNGLVNQGGRYFSNLFLNSTGMYGFKTVAGNVPSGTIIAVPNGSSANTQATTTTSTGSAGSGSQPGVFIRIGVGRNETNKEDYKLEEETVEGTNLNNVISLSSAVLNVNRTHTGSWDYEYTISNPSADDITFYEVGLFNRQSNGTVLLGRIVNDTGWTIRAGGTLNFTYKITLCGATNPDEVDPEI